MSLSNRCLVSQLLIVELGKHIYLRSGYLKTRFANSLSVLTWMVPVTISNWWKPAGGAKSPGNSLSLKSSLRFKERFFNNELVLVRDKNNHWGQVSGYGAV